MGGADRFRLCAAKVDSEGKAFVLDANSRECGKFRSCQPLRARESVPAYLTQPYRRISPFRTVQAEVADTLHTDRVPQIWQPPTTHDRDKQILVTGQSPECTLRTICKPHLLRVNPEIYKRSIEIQQKRPVIRISHARDDFLPSPKQVDCGTFTATPFFVPGPLLKNLLDWLFSGFNSLLPVFLMQKRYLKAAGCIPLSLPRKDGLP